MLNYRINWVLDRKTNDGTYLRMRVKWNNSKNIVSFTLPYRIDPEKWAADAQRCIPRSFHTARKVSAAIINKHIDFYESYIGEILSEVDDISKDEVKRLFSIKLGKIDDVQPNNFQEALSTFIKQESVNRSWAKDTIKRFKTLQSNIYKYNEDFSFDDCNEQGITNFFVYLSSVCKFRNSHIKTQLKSLSWFLRWALKHQYIDQYKPFLPKLKGADNNQAMYFLTWDELMAVYNVALPSKHLEQVRDVFVFCCFTSLRYSDVKALRRTDIYADSIHITTQKTDKELCIELNDYSREILNRYKSTVLPDNSALPVISNQKYNNYLKEIARIAGINSLYKRIYYVGSTRHEESGEKWQFITTHAARRTFVVNALYLGIPSEVIMRWTGHSDYNSMKPYIAIVDDLKKKQMNKFNQGPQYSPHDL